MFGMTCVIEWALDEIQGWNLIQIFLSIYEYPTASLSSLKIHDDPS